MGENGVFVFPDAATRGAASSIDPNLLLTLNQNGGFNNGGWIWLLFMWMLWGNNRNGAGYGYDANAGRDLIMQGINCRADALGQIAQITNTSVETVKSILATINSSIVQLGGQVGMSGLQVQNAIASGNAALSHQLCECCCENRLAILNQTNALQSQIANNHSASTLLASQNHAEDILQRAQAEAADQLAVCQQTNSLGSQADRNTNNILNAIAGQNTLITKEFCDLKEREL